MADKQIKASKEAQEGGSSCSMVIRKFARLIDVKSLVTLALVTVLCFMTMRQLPTPELFNSAVMLVLGFFFGKVKTRDEPEEDKNTKTEGQQ